MNVVGFFYIKIRPSADNVRSLGFIDSGQMMVGVSCIERTVRVIISDTDPKPALF